MEFADPGVILRVLDWSTWAVVGLSGDPIREAYGVAARLQRGGKRIVPIHPDAHEVLGEPGYPTLDDVPFPVDVVDVFRRSDAAGRHVDEAIRIRARAVWLQLGVLDEAAARRAAAAGLDVVMDRCAAVEIALRPRP